MDKLSSSMGRNVAVAAVAGALGIGVLAAVPTEVPGATLASISDMRSPAFFAIVNGGFLIFCGAVLLVKSLVGKDAGSRPAGEPPALSRLLAVSFLLVVYVIGIRTLGMVVSSVVMMAVMGLVLGYRNFRLLIPIALVFPMVVYVLFEKVLLILLPHGTVF